MSRFRPFGAAILAAAGALAAVLTVWAAPAFAKGRTGMVSALYVPTKDPAFQKIHDVLKERRVLETIAQRFARLRLPKPLVLKLDGCDGDINAWYDADDGTITVCYEYIAYLDEVRDTLPKPLVAAGLTREQAILGPFYEVFLHEMAHALFDLLKIPVLGREEDAADQLASYVLLQLGKEKARVAVAGIAFMYASEAREGMPKLKDYADVHGVSAQRFFNLLCLAHGKAPKDFPEITAQKLLPEDRAEGCEDEYRQVDYAWRTLIAPHLAPKSRKGQRRPSRKG